MLKLLTHVADIFTALTIRNRAEIVDGGSVRLIQPRSIVAGPLIDLSNVDFVDERPQSDRQYLKGGELILRTRGFRFEVALFAGDGVTTMAAAPLIILRADADRVLPEYLQWLINESPEVRRILVRATRGSTVQALNIEDLSKIIVPRPPLERQRRIVQAAALARQAAELEQRISHLKQVHAALVLSAAAHVLPKE